FVQAAVRLPSRTIGLVSVKPFPSKFWTFWRILLPGVSTDQFGSSNSSCTTQDGDSRPFENGDLRFCREFADFTPGQTEKPLKLASDTPMRLLVHDREKSAKAKFGGWRGRRCVKPSQPEGLQ